VVGHETQCSTRKFLLTPDAEKLYHKKLNFLQVSVKREIYMQRLISRFRRDDEGAALVEYGMLVGLIAVICVVAVTTLGTEVSTAFSAIASALSGI
jgi:pilus assembly protein Flp/PilA